MTKSSHFTPLKRLHSMLRIIRKANVLLPFFKDVFSGNYKIAPGRLLLFCLTLAYMIWPIDLIPDTFIIVGWLDDLILLSYSSTYLDSELMKYQNHIATGKISPTIYKS